MTEIAFLKEFDCFVSDTRHYYYRSNSIREAVADATNDAGKIMKGHGRELYRCLCSDNKEQAMTDYMNCGYHKYLKLFLSLTEMVDENGDISDNDGSVFLCSLMQLRSDVMEDIRYTEERRHKFAGLTYVSGLPVIAVPYIAMWGADTIPSLNGFYFGHTGNIIKLLLLCVTYICYSAVLRLREGDRLDGRRHKLSERLSEIYPFKTLIGFIINHNYVKSEKTGEIIKRLCEKYTVRTFYMLRILYFCIGVIAMTSVTAYGHYESRRDIIEFTGDISELSSHADGKQIKSMEEMIPKYTEFYTENRIIPEKRMLIDRLLAEKGIRTEEVAASAAEEIIRRTEKYAGERFGIIDAVLIVLFGLMCYAYPKLSLDFRKSLSENKMQDEVMQFQSLIHMMKKVPGISAIDILEKMEMFAEIFRPSLQQCINEYNISDSDAFERLYMNERYPGMRKIVDCFMLVDEMGTEDAFDEISSEIVNFRENRKLDRKILLDNEGLLGSLIAIIPGGLIVFGYLLCPFMIRSVQIFNSYQAELAQLS